MRLVTHILNHSEEVYLKYLLPVVRSFSDDIIVVNDFDNEETKKLCSDYKAKYSVFEMVDMKPDKINFAIAQIKDGDWAFRIDTDEMPSINLTSDIRKILTEAEILGADRAMVEIYHLTGLDRCKQEVGLETRLFRKNKSCRFEDAIHSKLVSDDFIGEQIGLGRENSILHFKYLDQDKIKETWDRINSGKPTYEKSDWERRLNQEQAYLPQEIRYTLGQDLYRKFFLREGRLKEDFYIIK